MAAKADAPIPAAPAAASDAVWDVGFSFASGSAPALDVPAMAADTTTPVNMASAKPEPVASGSIGSDRSAATTAPADQDDDWLDAPTTDPQTIILPTEYGAHEAVDTLPPLEADARLPPMAEREHASRHEAAAPQPSFLRDDARQPSVWRRPVVRIALLVVVLVLLLLLGAQFLVKERNRVAAVEPAMRPVLKALCAIAGCSVAPLRQIESIVIDSSSFSRLRDDYYQLGFSLKNTAPIDVAMPAIELSLTDPQDQPVIRRVILPTEFGAPTAALQRNTVWNGSLALTVQTGAGAHRIAGYRLLAFYP